VFLARVASQSCYTLGELLHHPNAKLTFFSKGNTCICVFTLGVKQAAYDPKGDNPDNLCALCTDECSKTGKYYNYGGAFRCMDDDVGEVAFVKHTTVTENKSGMESNYQYLCKDGTRKSRYSIFTLETFIRVWFAALSLLHSRVF